MEIREAGRGEFAAVLSVLEGAMLEVDDERVRAGCEGDAEEVRVLVACEDDRPLGGLVLEGREVTAVAVRPGRRDQGIGSALVREAADAVDGDVVAEFDADVRPFYESLGFSIESVEGADGGARYRAHGR